MFSIKLPKYFNLKRIADSGQCFHCECLGENEYRFWHESKSVVAKQGKDKVKFSCSEEEFLGLWQYYFSLDVDYEEINQYLADEATKRKDIFALKSLEVSAGIRVLRQPLFETACSYIISQRNNIPRIRRTVFEISENWGSKINGISFFPTREQLSKLSLHDFDCVKLGYRNKYLFEFVSNEIGELRTNDKPVSSLNKVLYTDDRNVLSTNIETLKAYNGIGDKVANCIALFSLANYDAFPIDTWISKILAQEYSKDNPFAPPPKYAGILQQYMFYTKRQG